MDREQIKVSIAGKSYPLKVDSSKKELYYLAEQQLRAAIVKIESKNYEGVSRQDAVALAAFDSILSNIMLRQQSDVDSDEMATLKAIESKIGDYMNDLKVERNSNR
ncbi:MAG: cell division protein ZapA [Rikenellaceae bacterium]